MEQHDAIVIGGGIAGAAAAYALRQRGHEVLLLEALSHVAGGASANPEAIVRPFLSLGDDPMRRFYHAAYFYTLDLMEKLGVPILRRGVLQFPKDEMEKRFATAPARAGLTEQDMVYLPAQQAADNLQMDAGNEALFWPRAVVISPKEWISKLLGSTPVKCNSPITKIERQGKYWLCTNDQTNETFLANMVVVASGYATDLLSPHAPDVAAVLRPRMGQISVVPYEVLPNLPRTLNFGGYFIPSHTACGYHIIGATFDHTDQVAITRAGHEANIHALQQLAKTLPELAAHIAHLTPEMCTGWAAVRPATRNHMPAWGMAAPGLCYLTGLGSRGMMSAPYAAQQLCDLFMGSIGIQIQ